MGKFTIPLVEILPATESTKGKRLSTEYEYLKARAYGLGIPHVGGFSIYPLGCVFVTRFRATAD